VHKHLIASLAFISLLFFSTLTYAADVVNLNKANAAAIQQNLIGIGPIKAEAIIKHRKKVGKFKSIDDLLEVKGIGPALVKKNKRYLSLSKGVTTGDDKAYAAAKKQAGSAKSTTKKKSTKSTSTKKASSKDSKAKKSTKTTAKAAKKDKSKSKSKTTAKPAKKDSKKTKTTKTKKKPAKKKTTKKKKKKPAS